VLPITPFPKGVSEDSQSPTKDLVAALLLDGWSVTEIARHLGVSKPTVAARAQLAAKSGLPASSATADIARRPRAGK
jgi:DNA-binding NarL/FixJ family response regulator